MTMESSYNSEAKIHFNTEKVGVKDWRLKFVKTDCGKACTPNGCPGHDSDMPEKLIIGGVPLYFNHEDYDSVDDHNALISVGVRLSAMIITNGGRLSMGETKNITINVNGHKMGLVGPTVKQEVVTDEGVLLSYEVIAEMVRKLDKLERAPLYSVVYGRGAGLKTEGTLYPGSKPACVKDGTIITCVVTGNA